MEEDIIFIMKMEDFGAERGNFFFGMFFMFGEFVVIIYIIESIEDVV